MLFARNDAIKRDRYNGFGMLNVVSNVARY